MHIDNVIFLILSKIAYTKFSEGPLILLIFLPATLPKVGKQHYIQTLIGFIYNDLNRILFRPFRVSISDFFPFPIMLRNTIEQHFLSFLAGCSCVLNVFVCTEKILLFLEHYFCKILTMNPIHALISSGIIRWNFLAFECIHRSSCNMGQKCLQLLVVLFFLASAAFLIGVHKRVVRHIDFVSAITLTMPNHRAAFVISLGGILGYQSSKSLPGNIHIGIILFMLLAGTSGSSACHKKRALHHIICAAGAFAKPLC